MNDAGHWKTTYLVGITASPGLSIVSIKRTWVFLSFERATESWDRKKNTRFKKLLRAKHICRLGTRTPRLPRASDSRHWWDSLGLACVSQIKHEESRLAQSGTCMPTWARVAQRTSICARLRGYRNSIFAIAVPHTAVIPVHLRHSRSASPERLELGNGPSMPDPKSHHLPTTPQGPSSDGAQKGLLKIEV